MSENKELEYAIFWKASTFPDETVVGYSAPAPTAEQAIDYFPIIFDPERDTVVFREVGTLEWKALDEG